MPFHRFLTLAHSFILFNGTYITHVHTVSEDFIQNTLTFPWNYEQSSDLLQFYFIIVSHLSLAPTLSHSAFAVIFSPRAGWMKALRNIMKSFCAFQRFQAFLYSLKNKLLMFICIWMSIISFRTFFLLIEML